MSAVEAEVFGRFRPQLLSLEKQLPYVFMCLAEEPLQGPRTGRVEFPHIQSPVLTGENPAKKHHLDHAGKTGVLVYHTLDMLLQRHHLVGRRLIQALVEP